MLQSGYTQSEIARVINKDKSLVSRELRRNADARSKQYKHDLAQRKYLKRQAYKAKPRTFTPEVEEYMKDKLSLKYSPEQIAGIAKKMEIYVYHTNVSISLFGKKSVKKGLFIST